jgi:hypothetical protein
MSVANAKLAFEGGADASKNTTLRPATASAATKAQTMPPKAAPVAKQEEDPKTTSTLISKFGGKSSPAPSSPTTQAKAAPASTPAAAVTTPTPSGGFGKIASLESRSSQPSYADDTPQERTPASKDAETAIRRWLEAAGGLEINDLEASLKSGEVLCNLMNKIQAGAIKSYHKGSKMAFKQMENIGWFLEAALKYGVKPSDLFVTVNLFEGNNMKQVVITLAALRKLAESRGFRA